MRNRDTLGIALATALAAVFAACGGGGAWMFGGHGKKPGKKDVDIVIWLDASCQNPVKNDPAVGYDDHKVTWHIRGDCKTADTLTLTSDDGLTDSCQHKCTAQLTNGSADLSIHVTKGIAGHYSYKIAGAVINLDPDLEIDP